MLLASSLISSSPEYSAQSRQSEETRFQHRGNRHPGSQSLPVCHCVVTSVFSGTSRKTPDTGSASASVCTADLQTFKDSPEWECIAKRQSTDDPCKCRFFGLLLCSVVLPLIGRFSSALSHRRSKWKPIPSKAGRSNFISSILSMFLSGILHL